MVHTFCTGYGHEPYKTLVDGYLPMLGAEF
jgi:hypothetical protein